MTDTHQLRAELAQARARVSDKTFAEAPEAFKDVESIKVRIWTSERAAKRDKSATKCDGNG